MTGQARRPRIASKFCAARLNASISHVSLVDPLLHILELFEIQEGKWLLLATLQDAESVFPPPFDAISFDLSVLCGGDRPARSR